MSKTSTLADIVAANGVMMIPTGNTAGRPANTAGMLRFNTDLNTLEAANGVMWSNVGSGSASSGGGGVTWIPTVQNTNFIAVKNNGYFVNTATGNVVVTLPATPTIGDNITFVDYGGAFSSNGLIFYPNGNKIHGNTINVSVTTSTAAIGIVYSDTNKGWVGYNGFSSSLLANYIVEYLIIAGGGGGGSPSNVMGGGGAGGLLYGSTPLLAGTAYTITVGSGGSVGANGPNSSALNISAIGGGKGAPENSAGSPGGSGGGGSYNNIGGSGTSGQGYAGGSGGPQGNSHPCGGGGGAGGVGTSRYDNTSNGGPGGPGAAYSISGTSTTYAGGGGGGAWVGSTAGGTGGSGGGGNGSYYPTNVATAGATNLGGGGGGGWTATDSKPGGSGIVILRYVGLQKASGGTITQSGGYTIHTFTTSGNFVA